MSQTSALPRPREPWRHYSGGLMTNRGCFRLLIWILGIALVLLIAYPILSSVLHTFIRNDGIYLEPFSTVARSRGIGTIVWNTVVYTLGSTVLASLFGGCMAWVNERTDARIDRLAGVLPVLPLMIPPMGTAVGYVLLLADQTGALNVSLRALFGLQEMTEGPIHIQNMWALVVITAITFAPINYLMIASALKNIDPSFEEAARIFGLAPGRTLLRVTLPAIVPAIASSMLLVAVNVMSAFTYPFILGANSGVTTISVYIYRRFSAFPPNPDAAMAAGVLMLLVVYITLFIQYWISKRGNVYTIAGKHAQASRIGMGWWRLPLRAFMTLYLVAVLLPVAGLAIGAFQPYLGASLTEYSLGNFRSVLANDDMVSALWNSMILSIVAATLAIVVAALLIYATSRVFRRGEKFTEFIMMTPAAIPQTTIAVAFIVAFSGPPFHLFGTKALIVLAYFVIYMPNAARAASSAISQVGEQLSEAAHISGAGMGRVVLKIVLPQVVRGLFAGWLIIFLLAINEVTVSAFLGGLNSRVLGLVSVEYFSNGRLGEVAVLSLIITMVTFVVVLAGHRLLGASYSNTR